MKIGLQTCFIDNYGACLQAYALKHTLLELGHSVDILPFDRYQFQQYKISFKKKMSYIKNNHKLYFFDQKYLFEKQFVSFRKTYLKINTKLINRNRDIFQQYNDIYDCFVCGSDVIWNPNFRRENLYFDMLGFANKNSLKIAYAPSFGITSFPKDLVDEAKQYLDRFDFISCRESDGVNLLKNDFNINNAVHVLDPTLLLSSDEWIKLSNKNKFKQPYVFIYMFDDMPIHEIIDKILSTTQYDVRIIPFGNVDKSIFKNKRIHMHFGNCGPLDFVNLINQSSLVIANSLHALAFSINLNKPFILFNRDNLGPTKSINSRLSSMVNMFKLEKKIINFNKFKDSGINEFIDINWEPVNDLLNLYRTSSFEYLKNALSRGK